MLYVVNITSILGPKGRHVELDPNSNQTKERVKRGIVKEFTETVKETKVSGPTEKKVTSPKEKKTK